MSPPFMLLSRYRHVIWDWNGTLLDDTDLCIDVMNGMLARRGLPLIDRERYQAAFDFPVRDYYARIGFDVDREFEQLSVEFITAYDARRFDCRMHAGAEAVLGAVGSAGASQSILSAYRQETLREIVGHFRIGRHFIRLNGLDNIHAHGKTDLGRAWIRDLGLPPAEVLMIGDTVHDHEVACAMGVDCLLVACGHHAATRLRARTDRVYDDLVSAAAGLGLP